MNERSSRLSMTIKFYIGEKTIILTDCVGNEKSGSTITTKDINKVTSGVKNLLCDLNNKQKPLK